MSTVISDEKALRCVAKNLARIMDEKGVSQAELSRRSGESETRISYYRNAKRLASIAAIARLCEALECTLDEMLL